MDITKIYIQWTGKKCMQLTEPEEIPENPNVNVPSECIEIISYKNHEFMKCVLHPSFSLNIVIWRLPGKWDFNRLTDLINKPKGYMCNVISRKMYIDPNHSKIFTITLYIGWKNGDTDMSTMGTVNIH